MTIVRICPFCQNTHFVEVPADNYFNWEKGMLAQHAFPTLSLTEREAVISGICPSCQDMIFGGED